MTAGAYRDILGGAYIADFSQVGGGRTVVIPGQRRAKHRCGTHLGICNGFRHFMAGNGGDVLKLCTASAMGSLASASGPKVRQDPIGNQTGSIRVVGAEPARGATRCSSKADVDSGREINHVEGFNNAVSVLHRRRQMAGGKLVGQLRLDLVISKGTSRGTRTCRRNDCDCGVKFASSNRLVAALHRRSHSGDPGGAVFRKKEVIF